MSFALKHNITQTARFSRAADVRAILAAGAPLPAPQPMGKSDALARIRAQLAGSHN